MNLIDLIKSIRPSNHYLRMMGKGCESYVSGFVSAAAGLEGRIGVAAFKRFIRDKMQVGSAVFNENSFIQAACELTVMSDFLSDDGLSFVYERKVSPPKDVDFSFKKKGVVFNVEVKCASYKNPASGDDLVQVSFTNRAPTIDARNKILADITARLAMHGKRVVEIKNLDNTLKDFIVSTQGKVSTAIDSDVNVLVVCCKDELDMHAWRGYLAEVFGLLPGSSRLQPNEFDRVDYVLLTNIYNRHYHYYEDSVISGHWKIGESFNILYENKLSKRNVVNADDSRLSILREVFSSHDVPFEAYMNDGSDVPPGEQLIVKIQSMGVAWYADKQRQKGKFYFRE